MNATYSSVILGTRRVTGIQEIVAHRRMPPLDPGRAPYVQDD